jgi:fructose-bisphosphate aldolase, class II
MEEAAHLNTRFAKPLAKDFLQGQLGNPEGPDKPNKKYYDPRVWLRKAEESFSKRLEVAFEDLNCINRNA